MFKIAAKAALIVATCFAVDGVAMAESTKTVKFNGTMSGSMASVAIDTNGDSLPGLAGTAQGKSTLGIVSSQFFSEVDSIHAAPSDKCRSDEVIVPFVDGSVVTRLPSGELLYGKTIASTVCSNVATGAFTFENDANIVGGTGRYATVTGTMKVKGTGQILSLGHDQMTNFESVEFEFQSTLNVPK